MVAFGNDPDAFLGGLHAIVEGDRTLQVSGDPISLAQRIGSALQLAEPFASTLHALVLHALIERSWMPRLDDEPLAILSTERGIELRWPVYERGVPSNPILRRLLRARGLSTPAFEGVAYFGRWLERRGGVLLADTDRDDQIARMSLPRTRPSSTVATPKPAQRPRTCTPPEPVSRPAPPLPSPASTPTVAPHLPADTRTTAVLALFSPGEALSARDVMQALGWSRSTTRDVLARLVAAGALSGTAASARSPRQTYTRPAVGPGR